MIGSHHSPTVDDYEIVRLTQRWVLLSGTWHREAWIRDARGVRFVAIPDTDGAL